MLVPSGQNRDEGKLKLHSTIFVIFANPSYLTPRWIDQFGRFYQWSTPFFLFFFFFFGALSVILRNIYEYESHYVQFVAFLHASLVFPRCYLPSLSSYIFQPRINVAAVIRSSNPNRFSLRVICIYIGCSPHIVPKCGPFPR